MSERTDRSREELMKYLRAYQTEENKYNDKIIPFPQYATQKGNARRKSKSSSLRDRIKKYGPKIIAIILACIATGKVVGEIKDRKEDSKLPSIKELQEMGEKPEGLREDTLEMMEKYDEYFGNFNPDTTELTEESVISMIEEMETLYSNVISDKVAAAAGVTREDVSINHIVDRGETDNRITVKEETYNKLPIEFDSAINKTDNLKVLKSKVQGDKISKSNAVKKLRGYYDSLWKQVGINNVLINQNGKIYMVDYELPTENRSEQTTPVQKER